MEARSAGAYRRLLENGRINQQSLLWEWAVTDPAACYTWIMAQDQWEAVHRDIGGMSWDPDPLLSSLYFAWSERDPRGALEAIEKAKYHANMGQFEILWHLLTIDPMAAIPLFHEYRRNSGSITMAGVLERWFRDK